MDKNQEEFIRKEMERKKSEFNSVLEKIVPRLKKEIDGSSTILVTFKELKKEMGPKFEAMHPTSFYWGARLCLFNNGIYAEAKKKDDEKAFLMRIASEGDALFKTSGDVATDIMEMMVFGTPPSSMPNPSRYILFKSENT